MIEFVEYDVFGEEIEKDHVLRDDFLEPPFSVLDTKTGSWRERVNAWKSKGIQGELGREGKDNMAFNFVGPSKERFDKIGTNTSIFDPALCELMYAWFSKPGDKVLDPFAGGPVRGIVANFMGRKYTGIDIRKEQIDADIQNAKEVLGDVEQPIYICDDSDKVLDGMTETFDMVFSCPPYADLEVYSDIPGDISNMEYPKFMEAYRSIVKKSCDKLNRGGYAVFVVGEVRNYKTGGYVGFVPDTIKAFMDCGMLYYNEAILLNVIGTAMIRCRRYMKSGKLAKVHQNVLVFKKP